MLPRGTRYKIKTYASGARVKLTIAPNGRVIDTKPLHARTSRTKTGRRLARVRRRVRWGS